VERPGHGRIALAYSAAALKATLEFRLECYEIRVEAMLREPNADPSSEIIEMTALESDRAPVLLLIRSGGAVKGDPMARQFGEQPAHGPWLGTTLRGPLLSGSLDLAKRGCRRRCLPDALQRQGVAGF
jgi:hypothetical protein